MSLRKITEADLQGVGVIGMEDTPNLSAREMQEKVEEVVRAVVIPVINENVDNTASKQDLTEAVFNAGAGDMKASAYDGNMDGIVNRADNGFFTYTHHKSGNIHHLYGNGSNVKFISTATFEDGDVFMIGDNYYPAFLINGDSLPDGFFRTDMAVSCFVHGNCLNFKRGEAGLNFKIVGGTTQPVSPKENTIWVNTDTEITSWDFSASEPFLRSINKNLVIYPYGMSTVTQNGITFTVGSDGTISASGEATSTAFFDIHNKGTDYIRLPKGTYTLSGCPANGGTSLHKLTLRPVNGGSDVNDFGDTATFTLTEETDYYLFFAVYTGAGTVSNLVCKPQLEKGSAATSFVKGDATGQLWIKNGQNSKLKLNGLKKNGIMLFPQAAKVYNSNSGKWENKTLILYENGVWTELKDAVYYDGTWNYTKITKAYTGGTATDDSEYITLKATGSNRSAIYVGAYVDLTDYTELVMEGNKTAGSGNSKCGIFVTDTIDISNTAGWSGADTVSYKLSTTTGTQLLTLDISALKGFYYVWFGVYSAAVAGTLQVTEFRME